MHIQIIRLIKGGMLKKQIIVKAHQSRHLFCTTLLLNIRSQWQYLVMLYPNEQVLIDFSLTVKAATLIFIFGRCSATSSAKEGKSGSIYNLVKT